MENILYGEYSCNSISEERDIIKKIHQSKLELKQLEEKGEIDISNLPEIDITGDKNDPLLTIELGSGSITAFLSSSLATSREFTLAKEIERKILGEKDKNHVSNDYLQDLLWKIKDGIRINDKFYGEYSYDNRPGGHIVQLIDEHGKKQKKMMSELYIPSKKQTLELSTVVKTQVDDRKQHQFSFIDPVSLEVIRRSPPGTRFTGVMIPPDAWKENCVPPQCNDKKGKIHPLLVMVPTLTGDYVTNSGKRYYGQDTNPPTPRGVSRYFNGPDFKQKEESDSNLNNAVPTNKLERNFKFFESDTALNPERSDNTLGMLYMTAVHNRDVMNSHGHLNMLCDNVYGDRLKDISDQLPSRSRLAGLAGGFTWIKPGTMFGKQLNAGFSATSSSLNGKLHGNTMDQKQIDYIVDCMQRGGTSDKKIDEFLDEIDNDIAKQMSGPYVTSVIKGLDMICNETHPQLKDNEAIINGANTRGEQFVLNELKGTSI